MSEETRLEETYLGDGLYVSYDGYQIELRARHADGDHVVFLEPEVWRTLMKYINYLEKASK